MYLNQTKFFNKGIFLKTKYVKYDRTKSKTTINGNETKGEKVVMERPNLAKTIL